MKYFEETVKDERIRRFVYSRNICNKFLSRHSYVKGFNVLLLAYNFRNTDLP